MKRSKKDEINEQSGTNNNQNLFKVVQYDELMSNMIQNCLNTETKPHFIVSSKFISSWKQYCQSEDQNPLQISPMNEDIFLDGKLKQGLKYRDHYQIVNQAIYNIFYPFTDRQSRNKRNIRWQVDNTTNLIMPVCIIQFNYLILDQLILRKIDCGYIDADDLTYRSINVKDNKKISDAITQLQKKQTINTDEFDLTFWQLLNETKISKIYFLLRQNLCGLPFENYKIQNIGKLCSNSGISLSQLSNGTDKFFFIIERTLKGSISIFIQNLKGVCRGCRTQKNLTVICPCEGIKYCSNDCLNRDKPLHVLKCSYAEELQLSKRVDMARQPNNCNGLVGLKNLRNTCYMNSCLQCLSNTVPLTQYFLNEYFETEINKKNKLGTKGKLTKAYAKIIRAIWCEISETYAPQNFKDIVSNINPMFAGYAQHDVQEFFSFLIDGLHEDLNRIEKNPNPLIEDTYEKQEFEMAKQSWKVNLQRNQSIITDLMTGQYRSVLKCPDCNKKSIKFDPFVTVSLPLPHTTNTRFFMIFQNQYKKNQKCYFSYNNYSPDEWTKKACEAIDAKVQRCSLYLVTQRENIYKVGRESMEQIAFKCQYENKNLFLIQRTDEELLIPKDDQMEFTVVMIKLVDGKVEDIFFKFPMLFDKNNVSCYTITKRILKFIYNQAFQSKPKPLTLHEKSAQYEEYEAEMIKKQILKVYLKLQKTIDKSKGKFEIKFNREIQLKNFISVYEILKKEKLQPSDCEIQIRFDGKKTDNFMFERIIKYEQLCSPPPAPKNDLITLEACFKAFAEREVLQAGNEWFCPSCKAHKKAIKQINIFRAPQILVLHLKRFRQKGGKKQKNEAFVKFPLELNLEKYVLDQKPIQAYKQEMEDECYIASKCPNLPLIMFSTNSKPIYELYAVSNHMGKLEAGHYTAFAKNNEQWYKFDDSDVSQVENPNDVITSNAYLLFYERKGS